MEGAYAHVRRRRMTRSGSSKNGRHIGVLLIGLQSHVPTKPRAAAPTAMIIPRHLRGTH